MAPATLSEAISTRKAVGPKEIIFDIFKLVRCPACKKAQPQFTWLNRDMACLDCASKYSYAV